jgi:hypothetical protein
VSVRPLPPPPIPTRSHARRARRAPSLRRLPAVAALTAGMLLGRPALAQEPLALTGSWVGTWWMGKYEEPIELDLIQANMAVTGQVRLWGYPRSGDPGAASTVHAAVTGTVDGNRVQLSWTMPEQGQFLAEFTLPSRGTLFGLGGMAGITTGFELSRSQRAP